MKWTRIMLLILFIMVMNGCSSEEDSSSIIGVAATGEPQTSTIPSMSSPEVDVQSEEDSFDYFMQMDEELQAFVMVSDHEVVSIIQNNDNGMYQIKRYSFISDTVDLLWETDQYLTSITYNEEEDVVTFPVTYRGEETDIDWFSLDLKTQRVSPAAQSDNPVWTILYENNGIWGENKRTTERVHWTEGEQDCCAYWLEGGKQFVYIEWTGATIADGSGFEQLLKKFDIASGTSTTLLPEQKVWKVVGWLEPGRSLIVDHAFNEGVSINYTALYVVDLTTGAEQPLSEGIGDYGNYSDVVFSEKAGRAILQKDAKAYLLDIHSGELSQLAAWDSSDHRKYSFSPDGRQLAYHVPLASENTDHEQAREKLYVSDKDGDGAMEVASGIEMIESLSWSPSSKYLLVQTGNGFGLVSVGE